MHNPLNCGVLRMYRGYLRYFIGFFITIGLIIILIVLLFGGGNNGNKPKAPKTPKTLNSLASTDAQIRLTIIGPTNADQIHQQVQITIDRSGNTFNLIQGYENTVTSSQSYESNEPAFSNFLHALSLAGYTRGDNNPKLADDRGYCPLGQRYVFEVIENGKTVSRYWSSNCGKIKTYLGSTELTLTLFEAQIPDYTTLTQNAENLQ